MDISKCRYTLVVLALCLEIAGRLDRTSAESSSPSKCDRDCPAGHFLVEENCMCYPDDEKRCPEGSTFLNEKCRKIVCPLGEYYKGLCLQAICPPGLVWRSNKCQEPAYLTTVIDIENVLINEMHEKPIYAQKSGTNEIAHHTTTDKPTTASPPVSPSSAAKNNRNETEATVCCTIRTPRICKRYGQKWICFNRSNRICDSRVCSTTIVYLKPPEIKYSHPVLIMPPNPPKFDNCNNGVCRPQSSDDGVVDCSGCASDFPENCSPYCYKYMCPTEMCSYIDLDLYCSYYAGQFGCIKEDGCVWNWC